MVERAVFNSIKEKKGIWQSQVHEIIDYFASNPTRLKYDPHIIALEGIDGIGKTTVALKLASYMTSQLSLPTIILRTCGTSGMESLIEWAGININDPERKKQILADYDNIHSAQDKYLKKTAQMHDIHDRRFAGLELQQTMFSLINKYLDLEYYVISDRGLLSSLIKLREKAVNFEDFQFAVGKLPLLKVGTTIHLQGLTVDTVIERNRQKNEELSPIHIVQEMSRLMIFINQATKKIKNLPADVFIKLRVTKDQSPSDISENIILMLEKKHIF